MKEKDIITTDFAIHDLTLRFQTNSRYIHSAIKNSLEYFLAKEEFSTPDIAFSLFDSRQDADLQHFDPNRSNLLFAASDKDRFDIRSFGFDKMSLYADDKYFAYCIDLGKTGYLSYTPAEGRASGYLKNPEKFASNTLSGFIFMLAVGHLLKAKGYFTSHCSVVEKNGKGVLFPGFSGSGKTTACIALIREGFGFLGDDRPILRYARNGGVEFLSFPEHIDVTDKTINLFPELKARNHFRPNNNPGKKSFFVEDIYPGSIKDCCVPELILFPDISGTGKSDIERLPKIQAMSLFLPHSMLVFDKDVSKVHFDIIFDLIQSTDCYRLRFGTDVHRLSKLVESIL